MSESSPQGTAGASMPKPKIRIVTPEQFKAGYMVFHGVDAIPNVTRHAYRLRKLREDANYEVYEPEAVR